MRDKTDLIHCSFAIAGLVEMDLERLEEDPAWLNLVERDLAAGGVENLSLDRRKVLLKRYVNSYLMQERVLATMPATNGPADLTGIGVEVL